MTVASLGYGPPGRLASGAHGRARNHEPRPSVFLSAGTGGARSVKSRAFARVGALAVGVAVAGRRACGRPVRCVFSVASQAGARGGRRA